MNENSWSWWIDYARAGIAVCLMVAVIVRERRRAEALRVAAMVVRSDVDGGNQHDGAEPRRSQRKSDMDRWEPVPVPQGDGRHDIGDDVRAAIVERLTSDWSRDPDLTPEKARQLAMWAAASVRALLYELGTLRDLAE